MRYKVYIDIIYYYTLWAIIRITNNYLCRLIIIYIIIFIINTNYEGSLIHCMDNDYNITELEDGSKDPELYSKDEKIEDIKLAFSGLKATTGTVAVAAATATVTNIIAGDGEGVTTGSMAVGAGALTGLLQIVESEIIRAVEKSDPTIDVDRAQSPSIYDTDNISSSKIKSSEAYKENWNKTENSIIDFKPILEWIESLEDKEKVLMYSIVLILCSLQMYISIRIKDKINIYIDKRLSKFQNKNIKKYIEFKNKINSITNLLYKIVIIIFVIFSIIGMIMVIFYYK